MNIYSLLSEAAKNKLKYYPKIASRIPLDIARLEAEARAEANAAFASQEAEAKKADTANKAKADLAERTKVLAANKAKEDAAKIEQLALDKEYNLKSNSKNILKDQAKIEKDQILKDFNQSQSNLTARKEREEQKKVKESIKEEVKEQVSIENKTIKWSSSIKPTQSKAVGTISSNKSVNYKLPESSITKSTAEPILKNEVVEEIVKEKEKPPVVKSLSSNSITSTPKDEPTSTPKEPIKPKVEEKPKPVEVEKAPKPVEPPRPKFVSPPSPEGHPLSNLNKGSLRDSLKGMGIHVVDVETTGLQKSDKMFSAAHTTFSLENSDAPEVKESFFKVGSGNLDRKYYKTDESHRAAIESSLHKKHSSKVFGKKQLEGGSLKEYAKAVAEGTNTTPSSFLEELDLKISSHSKGSVLFTHNSNFENEQFNRLKGSSDEYDNIFKRLQGRNVLNSGGIFNTGIEVSNSSRVEDYKGAAQKAGKYYNERIVNVAKANDPTLMRKALGEYAALNVDVINGIHNQINSARLKWGEYTSIDTMNLSRALMSFGALNGDVDVGNLVTGDKVEHQAKYFLKEKEAHTAGSDADQQSRITRKIIGELDEYEKNPSYRSTLLQGYNKYLTENNAATSSFKSSLVNEALTINSKTDSAKLVKVHEFFDKALDRYSIASGDHGDRVEFHKRLKEELDLNLRDANKTVLQVKESLEKFADEFDIKGPKVSTQVKKSAAMTESLMEGLKNHKKIVAVAGIGLGASLLVGGGEPGKDKKYNTYDELYNSQYYGSGFADWQERNGSHKVLY